jgi:hypothetical protein
LKLLLDEMYSDEIAVQLRRQGHDVVAAAERKDLAGSPDETVFGTAALEGRALVTEDVEDHLRLFTRALLASNDHAGLVLVSARSFPRTQRRVGALVGALDHFCREHPADDALRNQLRWLP